MRAAPGRGFAGSVHSSYASLSGVGAGTTVAYSGSGKPAAPHDGDRRVRQTSVSLIFEEYTNGGWSTVNGIKIGSSAAAVFLSLIAARWITNPEAVVTEAENELYPGPGEVFALDNDYLNQYGIDTWAFHSNTAFSTTLKKYGTHGVTDDGSNATLMTVADMTPMNPQAFSCWFYTGNMSGVNNNQLAWVFGWDGAAATYGSNIILFPDHPLSGYARLQWTDDYDSTTTQGDDLVELVADTWYHIALIWDFVGDQVFVVINDTIYTQTGVSFNLSGFRGSEPPYGYYFLQADEDSAIDDLSVVKDVLVDPDIYIQHHEHGVPWSSLKASAKDLILMPAEGGAVNVLGDFQINGTEYPMVPAAFAAVRTGSAWGTIAAIVYNTEIYDNGGDYDHTTGEFTAPRDGTYVFTHNSLIDLAGTRGQLNVQLNIAGAGWTNWGGTSNYSQAYIDSAAGVYANGSNTVVAVLSAGDKVRMYCTEAGIYHTYSSFCGWEQPGSITGRKGDKGDIGLVEWQATNTYSTDEITSYGGKLYTSLQDTNLNKQPDTETSWWEEYAGRAVYV